MGQFYSVCAELIFKNDDPSGFCNVIKREINARNYDRTEYDLNDPFDCFKALTARDARCIVRGYAKRRLWFADFDACYSWGSVMTDIFCEAATELENGSRISIFDDEDIYGIIVFDEESYVCSGDNYDYYFNDYD